MAEILKMIDSKGRITIPKEILQIADIKDQDIIKVSNQGQQVCIKKVTVIEATGNSNMDNLNMVYTLARKLPHSYLVQAAEVFLQTAQRLEKKV